jgi:hypothetical protein
MVGASTRIPIVGPLAGEFVGKKITEFGTNPERLSMKAIGAFNKAKGQSVWGKNIQKGVNVLNKEYTPVDKAVKEAGKQINKLPADQRGFAKLPFVGDKPSQKEVLNSVIKNKTAGNVVDPLIQEAKKYKTAEEFVNSQVWYHGTNKQFNEFKIATTGDLGKGFYLTDSPTSAQNFAWQKSYAKGGKQNIMVTVPKTENTLTLGVGDIGKKAQEFYDKGSQLNQTGGAIEKLAKENGYDSILRTKGGEKELVIFDKKNIEIKGQGNIDNIYSKIDQTKSQLTDIWNKANKK